MLEGKGGYGATNKEAQGGQGPGNGGGGSQGPQRWEAGIEAEPL